MEATDWAVLGVIVLAGFMRGVTGFGASMVMAPPLSLIVGPVEAVIVALVLESTAAFVMFPKALREIKPRTLAFLTLPACFTVPIGGYLLLNLDPVIARKLIAGVVVLFSALLLIGLRYTGSPRPGTSMAIGSLVGVLLGSTSVGAPPVILYLLSGPDPQRVTRANLTVFVTAISVIGLVMLAIAGAITADFITYAAILVAPFLFATWVGGLLFERMSETSVRRFALMFMFVMGVTALVV